MDVVCVDLGGTHARFALATVSGGRVRDLGEPVTLKTADYPGIEAAWAGYARLAAQTLPRAAAVAVASPIHGDALKMTNSNWVLRPAALPAGLGVERLTLINDFGAVGHAVAQLPPAFLQHVAGPDVDLPAVGVLGIVGPGTGLGVAHVLRGTDGYAVMETEGGHIDWAPADATEDTLLQFLRPRFQHVSAERIVSGPGLASIHDWLARQAGQPEATAGDKALWEAALGGTDSLAVAALARFCQCLGSVAGDIALAQGAHGMVIAGGVGARLAGMLSGSGFAARFAAKGRMSAMLASLPIKLIIHPEPGLFGAAAAFAKEHAA